jgi:HK97 family phage major capsid protein
MPKQLTALQWNIGERQRKIDSITELTNKAESEGRALSDEDRSWVEKTFTEIGDLDNVIKRLQDSDKLQETIDSLSKVSSPGVEAGGKRQRTWRSLGEMLTEQDDFKAIVASKQAGGGLGQFSTRPVEVPRWLAMKAAITDDSSLAVLSEGTDAADNITGGPGGALPQVSVQPGIQAPGFQRLTVADLMAQGQATSNTIRYLTESAYSSGASSVHEGANKPASTFTFAAVNEQLVKIATFLPVSEEMLEDVPQLRSYLDTRMRQLVQIEEEDQLLNGVGTGDDINGLLSRTTQAIDRANYANLFDAIAAARMLVQTVGFAEPDGIIINPHDAFDLDVAKAVAGTGSYFSGGPYSQAADMPWGLRMVRTTAIPAGSVLVGAFGTQAQVFRKGGLTVDASNSHEDYFSRNLVAIRAEERLALAVYRINAFCEITNASS